jgi:hypothetical protein
LLHEYMLIFHFKPRTKKIGGGGVIQGCACKKVATNYKHRK